MIRIFSPQRNNSVLLIFCLVVTLLFSGILHAQNTPAVRKKVAVLPWAMNQSLQNGGGVAMASLVAGWLRDSKLYDVVNDQALIERMSLHADLNFGCKQIDCLKKISLALEVDFVISSELVLIDVGTGPLYLLKIISVTADGGEFNYEGQISGTEVDFLNFLEYNIEELFVAPFITAEKKVVTKSTLKIDSRPQKAEIYLDQEKMGITPLSIPNLEAGTHSIKLVLPGYEVWEKKSFTLKGAETKVVIGDLIKELGKLTISTDPSAGQVFLDNEGLGTTPFSLSVPSGEYILEIKKNGYENYRQKVTIIPKTEVKLEIEMLPGLSDQEIAELSRLRKLKEDQQEKFSRIDEVRLKRMLAKKRRRETERRKMKETGKGTVAEQIAGLYEKHWLACAEIGMIFVQSKEITLADLNLSVDKYDPAQLRRGFCIDPLEVTLGEFKKYLPTFIYSEYTPEDNYPVSRVTYEQANDFCQQKRKRLCTKEEWGKACQGPQGNKYFYGKEPQAELCRSNLRLVDGPVIAGSLKECRNELGIFDMSGNVWEWTDDKHFPNTKIVRGGSWVDKATPCDYRGAVDPTLKDDTFGFRCCADYLLER